MTKPRCVPDLNAERAVAGLPWDKFIQELREGTMEYWYIDHLMMRAANELEALRAAVGKSGE